MVGSVSAYTAGLRLNLSPSLPRGVYRLTALPASLHPGHLVVFPVPASVAAFTAWWVPILKPVAGGAGTQVCHTAGHLMIADQPYGPVARTHRGRTLPTLPDGCHTVPDGQVVVASRAPSSLDSRYFGFVPITTLTAGATPVWIWE